MMSHTLLWPRATVLSKSKIFSITIALMVCFANVAFAASTSYPYTNPWLATASVALLHDPQKFPSEDLSINVLPNRQNTPILGSRSKVDVRLYQQPTPTDLVLLIPGLGATADDGMAAYLASQLYASGKSVMILPDGFSWTFALGASQTGLVGIPSHDARDLNRLAQQALQVAANEYGLQYQKLDLMGYSMGAIEAAFMDKLNNDPTLTFSKVVLIDPPYDLTYSMSVLDKLYAAGMAMSLQQIQNLESKAYKTIANAQSQSMDTPGYFQNLQQRLPVTLDQVQFLIGWLFRQSLTDVIFTSQQIHDEGILATPASAYSREARMDEASTFGFMDYLTKFIMPTLKPQTSIAQLNRQENIFSLSRFLQAKANIEVLDSEDDFINRPNDILKIKRLLGKRAVIYSHGGHLGNLWYQPVQQKLEGLL